MSHQHPFDEIPPTRLPDDGSEVEGIAGAQIMEGAANCAWAVVVTGACVGVFAASPGNCRAACGLIEAEPLIAPGDRSPSGEIPVGMVDVGTLRGSEAEPTAGAALPIMELPDGTGDVAVKPIAAAPVCVGSAIAKAPVAFDGGAGRAMTSACAPVRSASPISIAATKIRFITLS
jgi:hypothetical protein